VHHPEQHLTVVGHLNPEDGSMFASETLVSVCLTARCTALLNLKSPTYLGVSIKAGQCSGYAVPLKAHLQCIDSSVQSKFIDLQSSDRPKPKSEGDLVRSYVCRKQISQSKAFFVWIWIRMSIQSCFMVYGVRCIMKFYKYSRIS
jgi:hypothetical protein